MGAGPGLIPGLAAIGRRAKLHRVPDALNILRRRRLGPVRDRFYFEMWEAAADQIGARADRVGGGLIRIRRDDLATFVEESTLMLDSPVALSMIGDRALGFETIRRHGVRVPEHLVFTRATAQKAKAFRDRIGGPVVVKPLRGTGGGRGVTTRITDERGLTRAIARASRFCRDLIVEEQVPGAYYRLTFLDGDCIGIVRRDPPALIATGDHTIRQLVARENERRLEGRPITALSPLLIDADMRNRLAEDGLRLSSKPSRGEVVVLKGAVNENGAAQNVTIRDSVPQDTIAKLGQMVMDLGIRFAGVDLMAEDISAPLCATGPAVIEVNGNPGIHHHLLVSDPARAVPVPRIVLEYLFNNRIGLVRV